MGPIGVTRALAPYLPVNPWSRKKADIVVAAAPTGSTSILPISYMYISMMGAQGLTNATKVRVPPPGGGTPRAHRPCSSPS